MSSLLADNDSQRGFSMIEVLVAMLIFSVVTLGVVPLLAMSMKAGHLSRTSSVAEELARNAMERVRGIKYFTSYDAKPNKRVDLLDLYYPQVTGAFLPGQSYAAASTNPPVVGTGGVFETVCPPPSGSNPACPSDIPAGYALTFKAAFVKPITGTTPQVYVMTTPGSTYRWDTASGGNHLPADLMDLGVTASWSAAGGPKTFTLRTIIGDRKFSPPPAVNAGAGASPTPSPGPIQSRDRIKGRATIDYTFHGETGHSVNASGTGCPTPPCKSETIADIGLAESRIQLQDFATADQEVSYGNVRIVRTYAPGQTPPATPAEDLAGARGATSTLHAPPTTTLSSDALVNVATSVPHPDLQNAAQARLYESENKNIKVSVDNELPMAQGTFGTKTGATELGVEFWLNNYQRDVAGMYFNDTSPVAYLNGPFSDPAYGYNPTRLGSSTSAITGALGTAGRGVTSTATAGFPLLYVDRLTLPNSSPILLYVQNFRSSVNCKSTATPGTATATATWSAQLGFVYDPLNDGKIPRSMSSASMTLNSSGNDVYSGVSYPDALSVLRSQNYLIIDGSSVCCSSTSDIYMFEERNSSGVITKRGYFRSITASKNPFTYVSTDARTTQAAIDGAIRIDTASLNQTSATPVPETATSMSLGKLSCESVDNR